MLTAYLKRQWKLLLLLAGAVAVFAAVFALYSLPVEAVALCRPSLPNAGAGPVCPGVLRLSPAAPGAGRAFTKGP